MESNASAAFAPSFMDRNRILIKGLLIGLLILLMLIPASLIGNLVYERQARREQVVSEVSSKWATTQTITGPMLVVPYLYTYQGSDGKLVTVLKQATFLPDALRINGDAAPEVRHRSLYEVLLYRSHLKLDGTFAALPLAKLGIEPQSVQWSEARLLLGITDTRGLEEEVAVQWNGATQHMEAGVPENTVLKSGLGMPVQISANTGGAFSIDLKLRGSESLYFTPVGKTTDVTLRSSWKHPAFDGKYLPDTAADISVAGFSARWKVLNVSRSYPQAWKDGTPDVDGSAFGVRLIQPADGYVKTERSVKYAILFIALTFTIFFFLEILQKKQIHPLQYLLVGFALTIFYTLLLSISEYTGFNIAYAIATAATVALIGLYTWGVFQSGKTAAGFSAALGGLYSYIYILIQLEDYALLFGSIGLFVILAVIMYFSRKIDWYGHGRIQHTITA